MSPRPSALEADIAEMAEKSPAMLEIGTDADIEKDNARFQAPEPAKRKLTAPKAAAATGLEKDKEMKSTTSLSGGEAANPVDRPRQQEAAVCEAKTLIEEEGEGLSKFATRTDQEFKDRVEDLRRAKELEELKELHEKLENSEAEMKKLI